MFASDARQGEGCEKQPKAEAGDPNPCTKVQDLCGAEPPRVVGLVEAHLLAEGSELEMIVLVEGLESEGSLQLPDRFGGASLLVEAKGEIVA